MPKEAAIDISQPMDLASPQNVTTLHKRETDPEAAAKFAPNATVRPVSLPTETDELKRPLTDKTPAVEEDMLSKKLSEAQLMLAHAAETGKVLSPDVIATLTNARAAHARHARTKALTEQFWPAYTKLCDTIKPVTGDSLAACAGNGAANILKRYRVRALCLAFAIIPISVVMFINTSISNEINVRIKENNALVVKLHDQLQNFQPERPHIELVTQLQQLATLNRSLYSLASFLSYFIFHAVPDTLFSSEEHKRKSLQLEILFDPAKEGPEKIKTYQDIRTYAQEVQEMNLVFSGALTAYCLPILYALLGACACALRSLSQQVRAKTYTPTCADFARIIIALIAGLVVGLFNNFTQGISLSPLAVAFLVGYGVEIFFSFLDTFLETLKKVRS
jgi:hypothetical protein